MITVEIHTVNQQDGTETDYPANAPLTFSDPVLVAAIEETLNRELPANWSSVVVTIVRNVPTL